MILSLGYFGLGTGSGGTLHMTQTASMTNYTVSGGLSIAFILLISSESSVLRASSAFLSYGLATLNSLSQSSLINSASFTRKLTSISCFSA